ncbi:HNH endonuclease [Paraburkholderia sp. BCC1886]|uniref:HNH endonuclease n=1 Tax=Paraburkholderia sp. BCC1886 TaxID=2562670 RepID=UPI0021B2B061|nr:HNH endonuclease [Paraburkholderia sp. BCC1886]
MTVVLPDPRTGTLHHYPKAGNMLTPSSKSQVVLHRRGQRTTVFVGHLVATAFLGPAPEGYLVCYRDGDRQNCQLSNLYWDGPPVPAYVQIVIALKGRRQGLTEKELVAALPRINPKTISNALIGLLVPPTEERLVHISRWLPKRGSGGALMKVYVVGAKRDAPKPVIACAALDAKHRYLEKRDGEARRARRLEKLRKADAFLHTVMTLRQEGMVVELPSVKVHPSERISATYVKKVRPPKPPKIPKPVRIPKPKAAPKIPKVKKPELIIVPPPLIVPPPPKKTPALPPPVSASIFGRMLFDLTR